MKPITLFILIAILIAPAANAEAIPYKKDNRNDSINRLILRSLRNPEFKWVRMGDPEIDEYGTKNVYTIESEIENTVKVFFCFEELDLSKHPDIHNLNDIFENCKTNMSSFELGIEQNPDDIPVLIKIFHKYNVISQKKNSICYEFFSLVSERKMKVNMDEKNLSDEFIPIGAYSFDGPGIIRDVPIYYILSYIVDLGEGVFHKYDYGVPSYNPSEEEKKQYFKHFKCLEAEIRHVQS